MLEHKEWHNKTLFYDLLSVVIQCVSTCHSFSIVLLHRAFVVQKGASYIMYNYVLYYKIFFPVKHLAKHQNLPHFVIKNMLFFTFFYFWECYVLFQSWYCTRYWTYYLTLTPSPPFSFLAYLLGKGGVKKRGFPLGFEPATPRTTMHCSPMARHPGVAARAAISFPYETRFYDVIGLSAFSSLPLVGFCWTVDS